MILRKDGVDMMKREMETADAAPGAVRREAPAVKELSENGITVRITGENLKVVDNICIYFKEDKDE